MLLYTLHIVITNYGANLKETNNLLPNNHQFQCQYSDQLLFSDCVYRDMKLSDR